MILKNADFRFIIKAAVLKVISPNTPTTLPVSIDFIAA